jgi:hypothetical protein
MLVNRGARRCLSGLTVLLGLVDVVEWSLIALDSMTTLVSRAASFAGTTAGPTESARIADFSSDADLSKAFGLEDEQPDENAPTSVSQKASDR